jgi:hypothetical protein
VSSLRTLSEDGEKISELSGVASGCGGNIVAAQGVKINILEERISFCAQNILNYPSE